MRLATLLATLVAALAAVCGASTLRRDALEALDGMGAPFAARVQSLLTEENDPERVQKASEAALRIAKGGASVEEFPVLKDAIDAEGEEVSRAFLWSSAEELRAKGRSVPEPTGMGLPHFNSPGPARSAPASKAGGSFVAHARPAARKGDPSGGGGGLDPAVALVEAEGVPLPTAYDPRKDTPCAPKVVGEQKCGDCTMWATAESYGWRYCLEMRRLESFAGWSSGEAVRPDLSRQYGLDCIIKSCHEGSTHTANLPFFEKEGWATTKCRPYRSGRVEECDNGRCTAANEERYHIDGWEDIPRWHWAGGTTLSAVPRSESVRSAKEMLLAGGPVYACVRLPLKHAFSYGRSRTPGRPLLFAHDPSPDPLENTAHAVTLVGWSVTGSGEEYWIIQNSWGGGPAGWGDHGYGYLPVRRGLMDWERGTAAVFPTLKLVGRRAHLVDEQLERLQAAAEARAAADAAAAEHEARREDEKTESFRVLATDELRAARNMRSAIEAFEASAFAAHASYISTRLGMMFYDNLRDPKTTPRKRCDAFYELLLSDDSLEKHVWLSKWELEALQSRRGSLRECETHVRSDLRLVVSKVVGGASQLRWLLHTDEGMGYFDAALRFYDADCRDYNHDGSKDACAPLPFLGKAWEKRMKRREFAYPADTFRDLEALSESAATALSAMPYGSLTLGERGAYRRANWFDESRRNGARALSTCRALHELCCGRFPGGVKCE